MYFLVYYKKTKFVLNLCVFLIGLKLINQRVQVVFYVFQPKKKGERKEMKYYFQNLLPKIF